MTTNLYYELKSLELSAHRSHINTRDKAAHDAFEYLYTNLRNIVDEMFEKLIGIDPSFRIECESSICIEVIDRSVIKKYISLLETHITISSDVSYQDDVTKLISTFQKFLYLQSFSKEKSTS